MSRVLVESGIEWIGKYPAEWNLSPLRGIVDNINEKNNPIKFTNVLSLTNKLGVVPYEEKGDLGNISKEDISQYKIAYKDTVIINSMNLKIGSVGYSNYDGCVSPVYYVLKNNEKSDISFINYIFQSNFQKYLGKYGKGILEIREKISMYDILHSYIPVPSLIEQKRIASYLDKICTKIDEIINDNNREVELLQEYKSNFISKVIEKGMTGGVKKIDNKYISSIPNNSSLVMLKQITNLITDGTHQTPTYISDGIPFLSIKDISSGIIDLSNCKYISNEEHKALSKHANIEKNDLLFCRIGTLGKSIVVEEKFLPFDIFVSLGLIKIKKEIINPYYLKYVMESNYYKEYIEVVKIDGGVSAAKFNLSSVKSSPIILPKLDEQNLIVKYLNKQCSKLDQVIKYRKQIIEKLEEYKRSLIYECVTGKREV